MFQVVSTWVQSPRDGVADRPLLMPFRQAGSVGFFIQHEELRDEQVADDRLWRWVPEELLL